MSKRFIVYIIWLVFAILTPYAIKIIGVERLLSAAVLFALILLVEVTCEVRRCCDLLEELINKEAEPKKTDSPTTPPLTGRQRLKRPDQLK